MSKRGNGKARVANRKGTTYRILAWVLSLAALAGAGAWDWDAVHADPGFGAGPVLILPANVDSERWGTARCNDGTPFGFMFERSPDGSKDWVIFLEGGGFCDDHAIECDGRDSRRTSSPGDQAIDDYMVRRNMALFASDPGLNPSFFNANKVWAFYCSSDVWSGDTIERRPTTGDPAGWYFSGRSNARAMLEVLIDRYGLDDTDPDTRVLYAGGSAGGEGVQATADIAAELLPMAAGTGRLRLVNDAGSVFEFDHPDYSFAGTGLTFPEIMVDAYEFWGSRLNPMCEAVMDRLQRPAGTCFDQVEVYPFIVKRAPFGQGLPLLVQHSSIDGFQVKQYGVQEPEALELFRNAILEQFDRVRWKWLFSGGERQYHCATIRNDNWLMGPEGSSFQEVLTRFWEGSQSEVVIFGNP